MRTSKPISCISYNTENYLREKIFQLKKSGVIEYAMYIQHQPDKDDTKPHFHVYMQPSQLLQTENLRDEFIELDLTWQPLEFYKDDADREKHEKKQFLGVTVFRNSKEEDWILYGLHDSTYLLEKGLERNIGYEVNDILSTCDDTLMEMVSRAFDYRNNKLEFRLIDAVRKNMTWYQIVASGMIPLNKMSGAKIMYSALTMQADIE